MVSHIDGSAEFWGFGIGLELLSVVLLLWWFRRAGLRS
jgi:hypothetical protein